MCTFLVKLRKFSGYGRTVNTRGCNYGFALVTAESSSERREPLGRCRVIVAPVRSLGRFVMTTLMTVRDTRRFALLTLIAGLAVLAGFLVLAPVTLAEERPGGGIVTMDEQHGDCNCTYVYSKTYEYLPCSSGHCHAGEFNFTYLLHRTTTVIRDCFDDQICDIDMDDKCSGRRCYGYYEHGHGVLLDSPDTWGLGPIVSAYCIPGSTVAQADLVMPLPSELL